MIKQYVLVLVIFLLTYATNCQELAIFENYYTSHQVLINPAVSGIYSSNNISFGASKQWFGIKNSPFSQSITASLRTGTYDFYNPRQYVNKTKFSFSDRIGIGFALFNNIKGPLTETCGLLSYAYHLPAWEGTLSMRISGIISRNLYDYSNTHPIDASDPALQKVTEHKLTADANAGLVFYKKNWYAGISVLELFKSEYFLNSTSKNKFDYYILAGYYLNLNRKIRFEPLLVCKKINSEKINFDIHTNFSYDKIYNVGVSLHTRQYIAYNVKFRIYKHLYAGYAFLQQMNDFSGLSKGSHIINLYFVTNPNQ